VTERNERTRRSLALGVAAAVAARVFGRRRRPAGVESPPRSGRWQTAYGWLLAGAAPTYCGCVRWRRFTPLYAAGAIRHAFLLGFATLMIMAMAYRTVPVFSGRPLRWPAAGVPASFALVASAAVLRVLPVAFTTAPSKLDFKLMTAGGFLLFFGLAVFAAEIASSMFGWFAAAPAAASPAEVDEVRMPSGGRTRRSYARRAAAARLPHPPRHDRRRCAPAQPACVAGAA
jgi:hypothetical protein